MMSFSSSSARRNRVLYSSSGCNRAALGVARPPLPSILEASSFSVEEEASSSVRSRVGRGSGAISAAPATRESAPTLLCKNATEETHTTARLECVVVVGKIAKDFADAIDDIFFFFFFAFYERCVSKGATSSVDRDGSRGEDLCSSPRRRITKSGGGAPRF